MTESDIKYVPYKELVKKQWYNNQTPEKQQEMRIKARKYNKNRYDNMMVVVRE